MPSQPLRSDRLLENTLSVSLWPMEMPRVAIADEVVVFKDAVFDAPAQEETNAPVVFRAAVADDGVLTATARVQAQVGVVRAGAVFDCDVLALLGS